MFENYPSPIIFAHRGDCSHAPENTLPSFELAVEKGTDAIELDVKLSADNQAVVIHDQTVDRTTNGTGRVNRLNLDALKKLDAGSFLDAKFSGTRIPTLDEVFESVGKRVLINVELTNYASPKDQLIPIVAEIVKKHKLESDILFSSFRPVNLVHMRELLPATPVAILCQGGILGAISRSSLMIKTSPGLVHPNLIDVNPEFVKREHRLGRRVHVWTVNRDKDILRLKEMGVDGIFTDDPLNAMKVLGRK